MDGATSMLSPSAHIGCKQQRSILVVSDKEADR